VTILSPLGAPLMESDRRYFELGADGVELDGATVVWMAGLEHVPGACVVQRVRPERIRAEQREWVAAVTDRLRTLGCSTARVYLDEPVPALESALADAGFAPRLEIGYTTRGPIDGGRTDVVLRPIAGEPDWELKHKLHAGSDTAADGHVALAEEWVELERRKCGVDRMKPLLVEVGGDVCGAVATFDVGDLVRAKNLFVHPDHRREGNASGVMRALAAQAADTGKQAVGIFGVPGNPGDAVYQRLAMVPVLHQFEWSLDLDLGARRD
jgi:GNAT superfamily N-acetyltransferase